MTRLAFHGRHGFTALVLAVLCVLPAGCIISAKPLFDEGKAVAVISPGNWRQQECDRETGACGDFADRFTVTRRDKGFDIVKAGEDGPVTVWFYPLEPDIFVISLRAIDEPSLRLYGLARLTGDGVVEAVEVSCGARPDPAMARLGFSLKSFDCRPPDRASLIGYLRTLKDKKPFARFKRAD